MDHWRRLVGWLRAFLARSSAPWYRRPDVWVLVGTILLPFGWSIALCRIGWAYLSARRAERLAPVLATERSRPPGRPVP
jgi:hypothetical protein